MENQKSGKMYELFVTGVDGNTRVIDSFNSRTFAKRVFDAMVQSIESEGSVGYQRVGISFDGFIVSEWSGQEDRKTA